MGSFGFQFAFTTWSRPPLSLKFRRFSDSECRNVEGFLETVLGLTWAEAAAAVSSFAVVVGGAMCCATVAMCAVSNEVDKNVLEGVLPLTLLMIVLILCVID